MKWISVKERLPDIGQLVMVYGDKNQGDNQFGSHNYFTSSRENHPHGFFFWDSHCWKYDCCHDLENPTHWMPLPEPPEDIGSFLDEHEKKMKEKGE